MNDDRTVAIIGLGYVGLPLALLADQKGYRVIGVDLNDDRINVLRSGHSPIADQVPDAEIAASKIEFSSSFERIAGAGIVVICVPTPVDARNLPNLAPVRGASTSVAKYLKPGQLIVLESTVNPGVCESIVQSSLESVSGLKAGQDFHLAHCPERINPGDASWNVANIPRVVGATDKRGLAMAVAFYRSIISGEVKPMASIREAEAVKVVENSFRDINIAFVNELAMSFDKLGINVVNVIEGAATKPFAFMPHFPGCGVGGHCIPVDPYYLIEYARENGYDHEFLSLARNINRRMPKYTATLASDLLAKKGVSIDGATVTVLGLSYKANIGDTRESPAFDIIDELESMGAHVRSYDPFTPVLAKKQVAEDPTTPTSGRQKTPVSNALFERLASDRGEWQDVLIGTDAVVIATNHQLFVDADPQLFARAGVKVVVDGRNCLDATRFRDLGILYKGIGR
jgi:UDP-N-acetyl-D-glucosamine dehydrogenase